MKIRTTNIYIEQKTMQRPNIRSSRISSSSSSSSNSSSSSSTPRVANLKPKVVFSVGFLSVLANRNGDLCVGFSVAKSNRQRKTDSFVLGNFFFCPPRQKRLHVWKPRYVRTHGPPSPLSRTADESYNKMLYAKESLTRYILHDVYTYTTYHVHQIQVVEDDQ